MCVVDPMANLKVAIHRAARDRAMRERVGVGTFLPATRLIVEVLDSSKDLELTTGLLEEASLLDAGVAQAMVSLHLHAARFIDACRSHIQVRPAADALLRHSTLSRLTHAVLTGKLAAAEPETVVHATVAQPKAISPVYVEARLVDEDETLATVTSLRAAWPAPSVEYASQLISA